MMRVPPANGVSQEMKLQNPKSNRRRKKTKSAHATSQCSVNDREKKIGNILEKVQ